MSKMIHTLVPFGVTPQQIEGFPMDCERSVKGSLHIRPGTLVITEGELAHLRKHYKDVARRLIVTPTKQAKRAMPAPATQERPKAEPAPDSTPKASGSRGGRRGSSGSTADS